MAGYIGHIIHGYETFVHLSNETQSKMPIDALRSFILGEIVPDLTEKKATTHFYKDHPIYGKSYQISDIDKVEKLFLRKNPTYLGILAHLKCDNAVIEWFSHTDPNNNFNELYSFYDKSNNELVVKFMPKLNKTFGTNFSEDLDGFLSLVKLLFIDNIPMTGISEMDEYRYTSNISQVLKDILIFGNCGNENSQFRANTDDYLKIIEGSAAELAKIIDNLYAN